MGAEFPAAGKGSIGDCVDEEGMGVQVEGTGVATEEDVLAVGERRGGLKGQDVVADRAARLEQGEAVVASDAADAGAEEAIVGEGVPEGVGEAVEIRAVEECAEADGEGRLEAALELVVERAREVEEGAEIFVAEGVAFAAEEEGVAAAVAAVERGILVLHGVDDDAKLVGAAVGDGEVVVADALRVEPECAVGAAADLPEADNGVGVGLVDGEDGGGGVGAEAVGDEGQCSVGEAEGGVEIGEARQGGGHAVGGEESQFGHLGDLPHCTTAYHAKEDCVESTVMFHNFIGIICFFVFHRGGGVLRICN